MEKTSVLKLFVYVPELKKVLGVDGGWLPLQRCYDPASLVLDGNFPAILSCGQELGVDDPRRQGQVMDSADLDGSDFGSNNDNDLTLLASTNQTEMSEVIINWINVFLARVADVGFSIFSWSCGGFEGEFRLLNRGGVDVDMGPYVQFALLVR